MSNENEIFMEKWAIKNRLYFIGAALGAIAGFLYWKYVGCLTGTCAITSNPIISTLYFAATGALVSSVFKKNRKTTTQ